MLRYVEQIQSRARTIISLCTFSQNTRFCWISNRKKKPQVFHSLCSHVAQRLLAALVALVVQQLQTALVALVVRGLHELD